MSAPFSTAQQLRSRLRRDFDLDCRDVQQVEGGLDVRARVWRVLDDVGASWSVKESQRDGRFGLALAASLAESGIAGIGAPVRSVDGAPWSERGGVRMSVAPWIDGEDAATVGTITAHWLKLGETLRSIHEHDAPSAVTARRRGIRRLQRPAARLDDIDRRVAAWTPDGDATSGSDRTAATIRLWTTHRERLADLADAERRLKRTRRPAVRVPLHGDPHLGNVIIGVDGLPSLIDFDEATVAPREVDLMLIELGVIFSMPITDVQRRAFRDGYGSVDLDFERIARFGSVRAIEDAATTMLQVLDGPAAGREGAADILAGVLGAHGLVTSTERYLERMR